MFCKKCHIGHRLQLLLGSIGSWGFGSWSWCILGGIGFDFFLDTFFWNWEGTALGDLDGDEWLVAVVLWDVLDLVDDFITLDDFTEDDVAAIEPAGDDSGDEELRSVGVWSGVGHAQKSLAGVLQLEVLIRKLLAVDRLATSAVTLGEVTALNHEVTDDTMESRSLITESLFAGSESMEVFSSLWNSLSVQSDNNSSEFLITVFDIKEDLVGDSGALGTFGDNYAEGHRHHEEGEDTVERQHRETGAGL